MLSVITAYVFVYALDEAVSGAVRADAEGKHTHDAHVRTRVRVFIYLFILNHCSYVFKALFVTRPTC